MFRPLSALIMDFQPDPITVRVGFAALTLLLSWRLWKFTIRPRLNPDEPKELPYWIPCHASSFFLDFNGVIEYGRQYFSPSREPFAIVVGGQTIYVATSPEDINYVWRNSKTISMDPITMDMYTLGGISENSRKAMFEKHAAARYNAGQGKPLTPTEKVIDLHHQQLYRGPRLDSLIQDRMLPSICKALDMTDSGNQSILSRSENSVVISLHNLCVHIFITKETEAYFGPTILNKSPELINAFLDWELCSWKFLFQLPDVLAQDMVKTKRTITDTFANYYRLPRSERPGSIFFVDALEDMLREVGLTESEMGHFTLLHYWA
ncbi:hypothetical protein DM02DRAFT_689708 [Periconia macrospinosa]|uniref:Cytochrome P450 n=1 Tax=Periconia macrospinosa TaxID=97972 RepID=A0A2V1E3V4_9PLEO|nr:hypothetical protein DM02DRAFT_689708 [Periconia macrospinosa]